MPFQLGFALLLETGQGEKQAKNSVQHNCRPKENSDQFAANGNVAEIQRGERAVSQDAAERREAWPAGNS